MSRASEALTRALSKDLQATVRAHLDLANRLLEPAEVLLMPIVATVEASGGAIGSIAATIGNMENADNERLAAIVADQIARHHQMLLEGQSLIVAEAAAAIAAEKARTA